MMMTSPSEPRRVFRRWSAAELDQLQRLAGEMPFVMVVERFNKWAAGQGLPPRTPIGIRKKCNDSGVSVKVVGEYLRLTTLASILGISEDRTTRWVKIGWLPAYKMRCTVVTRIDLRRMARTHPHAYAGIPWERLFSILEDADLARSIAAKYTRLHGHPHAVRCIETGRVYRSIKDAAAHTYCHSRTIQRAVHTSKPVFGRRWEYAK